MSQSFAALIKTAVFRTIIQIRCVRIGLHFNHAALSEETNWTESPGPQGHCPLTSCTGEWSRT